MPYNIEDFFKIEKDLLVLHKDAKLCKILGLCSPQNIKSTHLAYIGSSQYLDDLLLSLSTAHLNDKFVLLLDQRLHQSLENFNRDILEKLIAKSRWLATIKNFEKLQCELTGFFYREHFEKVDLTIDGRKNNSVRIKTSAQIFENSFLGSNVQIGDGVKIFPYCTIMANSTIAEGTILFPNTTIYSDVSIGKNCRIHSGASIGADGFGYNFLDGEHQKIWHYGGVRIEDNVEIGANSCIDGGTFEETLIGRGTKIDNHVQIGHNCQIGKFVILCGQVAIGGSSKIGDYTVFGGKSGMGHSMRVGDRCQIAGGALINNSWPDHSILGGHPARDLKEWMKGIAYVRKKSLKSDCKTKGGLNAPDRSKII